MLWSNSLVYPRPLHASHAHGYGYSRAEAQHIFGWPRTPLFHKCLPHEDIVAISLSECPS